MSLLLTLSTAHAWDFKDFKEEALVPVTHSANILMTGTVVTLAALSLRNPLGQDFEEKHGREKILGSYSSWGDYAGQLVPNAGYVIYQSILGTEGDPEGYRRAMGMFKATAYAGGVTSILKYTIRAPRPNDNSVRNSFPSGHSATAFAFSGYVAAEHGWGWGTAATLLSVYCGYSRIHDQMHRIHEVSAGATIGLMYGWGISKLQKSKSSQESSSFGGFNIAPIVDLESKGIAFYKEF